ncbi:OsmC family protein [Dactylosporangium sp. NPDC051485]|uniref:OsmC family protein n=1 Tax=Dactylosporangium sp. NPDC051485 TaxID=3154846 RepID=UPI00341F2E07
MPTRVSSARWEGDLRSGSGTVATGSGTFQGNYSFPSRFESGEGTNPEELVAAAHAACYSMALSNGLAKAGHTPTSVETSAAVQFGPVEGGFAITRIDLTTRGDVPGLDAAEFEKFAQEAKAGCPISKALAAVEITLDAQLV